ncbi:hypothetical protein MGWOODY_Smn2484 [hydrothermal vent metagenome]|uniref:Uncharacterized protein n=1 Tax=hydrothermal vent metagenome TaxID=652676 RepID=A0A160TGA3_9ZZZZ
MRSIAGDILPSIDRADLRTANDLAGSILGRVNRQQESLRVDVAGDNVVLFVLAVVRRDFVVPVGVEISPDTRNHAERITLDLLVARAEVHPVATEREPEGAGLDLRQGRRLIDGRCSNLRRGCIGRQVQRAGVGVHARIDRRSQLLRDGGPRRIRQIRVIEANALAIHELGVASAIRIGTIDETRSSEEISQRLSLREERAALRAERFRPHIFRFEEGHERRRNLEMPHGVEDIALQIRREHQELVFTTGHAVAVHEVAVRAKADAQPGLIDEAAIGLKKEAAGERIAERVITAWCTGITVTETELAAERDRRAADIAIEGPVDDVVRRRADVSVDDHEIVVLAQVRATRGVVILLMGELGIDRDVAATFCEALARDQRDILVAGIAIFADAGLGVEVEPVEIVLDDEVHHAGDRVGTVDRRVTAGHDVDALDQVGRQRVDVDRVAVVDDVGSHLAAAVDQHQRTRAAKAAQIEEVQAARAQARGRVLRPERGAELRHLVQHVADGDAAGLEDLLPGDRRDGNGRIGVGLADARAGDDDRFGLFLSGRRVRVGVRRCRLREGRRRHERERHRRDRGKKAQFLRD